MDNDELGRIPSGTGPSSQAIEPVTVSPVPASVPCAREMRMEWSTDAGRVLFVYPSNLDGQDTADLEALVAVAFQGIHRRASAIEARRAETRSGSVADESAVAKPDTENGHD